MSDIEGTSQTVVPQVMDRSHDEYYVSKEQYYNSAKEHCQDQDHE